jgi:hypothetical protein
MERHDRRKIMKALKSVLAMACLLVCLVSVSTAAYKDDYVVTILSDGYPAMEADGYAFIRFDSEYYILLKNNTDRRCSARVFIDGEGVSPGGDFVIAAHDELKLERFVTDLDSGRRFKFVRLDNPSVSDPSRKENGLIRVEFRSEVKNEWINENYPLNLLDKYGSVTVDVMATDAIAILGLDSTSNLVSTQSLSGATIEGSESKQKFRTIDFDVEGEFVEISLRLQGVSIVNTDEYKDQNYSLTFDTDILDGDVTALDGDVAASNYSLSTVASCYYTWEPKDDITAYELALCMPYLISKAPILFDDANWIVNLPENARRHFKEVCE